MRVLGLEETGTARDTQSKGRKEHSKEWSALQGLPLGQTPGSATAQQESGSTWFPCWGPTQSTGRLGRPHSGLQECADFSSYPALQKPCSVSWGGPGSGFTWHSIGLGR